MISKEDIRRAEAEGRKFKQAIVSAKYLEDSDRVELVTPLCTIIINRKNIEELRSISPEHMKTLYVSAVGLHVEAVDIDINAAGLITEIGQQLQDAVAGSF